MIFITIIGINNKLSICYRFPSFINRLKISILLYGKLSPRSHHSLILFFAILVKVGFDMAYLNLYPIQTKKDH